MKALILSLSLISTLALADSIRVTDMDGTHCEKQVKQAICKDAEMSKWFATCDAKVVDKNKEIGEIRYTLAPGQKMDSDKMSKIEKAIVATGRSLDKSGAAKTN